MANDTQSLVFLLIMNLYTFQLNFMQKVNTNQYEMFTTLLNSIFL